MASRQLNRRRLLERLEAIKYEPEERKQDEFEQLSLANTLLGLAKINHEQEYEACRGVAQHVLGTVPEPSDDELGEI
ncbi:MAG TPA: hypothetical protein VHV55_17060 [Pirellulales bacterium]|jgi:hypothetical protein|nr:hypothetical protein [Pirellulales bacterium]